MENLDCWAIFSNPYHDDSSKTEYLEPPTFSLQFFALSPQKLILATQQMTNKHLTFLVNVLFMLKHSFRVIPVEKFHNHTFCGVGCIRSKWQSLTIFSVKRIYINSGILTDSGYSFFKILIFKT